MAAVVSLAASKRSSVSISRYSGESMRSDNLCMMAGKSSMNKTRNWPSISFCK